MKYIKKFVGWYIWFIEKSFEGSDDVVSWIFDGCICLFLHAVAALIIMGGVLSIILYPNICLGVGLVLWIIYSNKENIKTKWNKAKEWSVEED